MRLPGGREISSSLPRFSSVSEKHGMDIFPQSPPADPTRRELLPTFLLEVGFYGLLTYVLIYAADYWWDRVVERNVLAGSIVFVLNTFLLYMHEGGHLLFSMFGRILHALGGSFWQVMLPFLMFVFAVRERSRIAPFPLYYSGFSLMDVSVYVRDAPYRSLPLLGGDKNMHDWWNILSAWNMLYEAETIADFLYFCGLFVSVAALITGFVLAFKAFFVPTIPASTMFQKTLEKIMQKRTR